MSRYGRKNIRKAEAVWKEDVCSLHPEFLLIELLSIQDVSGQGFRCTYIGIIGIPTTASHMPSAQLNILFHCLIFQRIVFLHPGILYPTLKIEDIVRITTHQVEVGFHGLGHIFTDGFLDIPVPLGIKMRIRHHISFLGIYAQKSSAPEKSQ